MNKTVSDKKNQQQKAEKQRKMGKQKHWAVEQEKSALKRETVRNGIMTEKSWG